MPTTQKSGWLDYTGATLSSLCAIQCATMPFLIIMLPFLSGTFFAGEEFEWLMILVVALIATTSLAMGFREHQSPLPYSLLALGLTTLIATRLVVEVETPLFLSLLALGGFTIAYAHWRNHLYTCRCRECVTDDNRTAPL